MRLDAEQLATAAGGVLRSEDASARARGQLCVDTRLLAPGDVFLALPGSRTDGSRFIADALSKGADGVIATAADLPRPPASDASQISIAVDDPLRALNALARAHRRSLAGHVIGVTGSVGKTSTVEMLAAALRTSLPTHATHRGFNTHRGVAATIAGAPEDCEALVVELSMQARGHIAEKAALLEPTAALVTNIAPVHLQTAGTIAEIARNKAELIEQLPAGAPCVLPADEPLLEPYVRPDLVTLRHGPGGDVSLRAFTDGVAEIDCGDSVARVSSGLPQPHNLRNLVAAVAMLHALGLPAPSELELTLSPLRWQRVWLGGIELILDCENSNPMALRAALASFASEPAGRRLAVLGELAELGDATPRFHCQAGALAARLGIDVMIVVGAGSPEYLRGYREAPVNGSRGEAHAVETPEEARALLEAIGRPGDRALVKGSRTAELERIAG